MSVSLDYPVTKEWSDSSMPGSFHDKLPKPDVNYFYVAYRLFSWFPVRNSKGATYFEKDVADDKVNDLVGRQVNLRHNKKDFITGTVKQAEKNAHGVDVLIEIDRELASAHGLEPEDVEKDGFFSSCSVETTWLKDESPYLLLDPNDSGTIIKELPGTMDGIERSTAENGYRYGGKYLVTQALKPLNFTGVGLVPNPADQTAGVYAMAASTDPDDATKDKPYGDVHYADPGFRGKSRYPVNDPEHVRAAAHYFGVESNRNKYSPEQRDHIDSEIRAAKKKMGIGNDDAAFADTHADPGYDGGPKRHPLDSEENVLAAKNHFDSMRNRQKYSGKNLKQIDQRVDTAMKRLGLSDEDACYGGYATAMADRASTTTPQERTENMTDTEIKALQDELARFKAELASKDGVIAERDAKIVELSTAHESVTKELASAKESIDSISTELNGLKVEKETAAKEAAIAALMAELVAIHPTKDDAEVATLRETAASAYGDDKSIETLKLARKVVALEAANAELKAKIPTPFATDTASTTTGGELSFVRGKAPIYETTDTAKYASADLSELM